MTILDLLSQDGIQLDRVSNFQGGEYAGPCLFCGGRDRFRCWSEEGEGGRYWCRACGKYGDTIQYLRDARKLSYFEACDFLGKEPELKKRSFNWSKRQNSRPKWEPRDSMNPQEQWVEKCSAFVDWCQNQLWGDSSKDTLEWLKSERGLSEETIKSFRLGWNPQDAWRDRKVWGLPEELKDDGKPKKLFLPAGVVIPYISSGSLQRVRIRRQDPNIDPKERYRILSGSSMGPMILRNNGQVFVIVESELDALLLYQEIKDMAGVIALGSAQKRPDKLTDELLRATNLVLVALDNDEQREDGKNPGAKEAWGWWMNQFSQARRLPPICGKDPCEMWKAGVSLRDWVEIGIEEESQQSIPLDRELVRQDSIPSLASVPWDGAKFLSSSLKYLAGISEDLTGWTLWKRIEQGKEHRFATDLAGTIRWEQWYSFREVK